MSIWPIIIYKYFLLVITEYCIIWLHENIAFMFLWSFRKNVFWKYMIKIFSKLWTSWPNITQIFPYYLRNFFYIFSQLYYFSKNIFIKVSKYFYAMWVCDTLVFQMITYACLYANHYESGFILNFKDNTIIGT